MYPSIETPDGVKALLARAMAARSARASAEDPVLQRLARMFRPSRAHFNTTPSPGQDLYRHLYDSTPQYAATNLAAGLFGSVMNPANKWFALNPRGAAKDDDAAVRYMDGATQAVAESLGPDVSGFYAEAPSFLTDLSVFGAGTFYSEFQPEKKRWLDKSIALYGVWIEQDADGMVRTFYCCRQMTADQILQEYDGDQDYQIPEFIRRANDPTAKYPVWWVSVPNAMVDKTVATRASREYHSIHVMERRDENGKPIVLRKRSDDSLAWMAARWERRQDTAYGDGRGHVALADAMSLQVARKSLLEAASWAARPPILAPEEKYFRNAEMQPAGIVYGGMNRAGRPMAQALETGQRMPFANEMSQQLGETVREAFYFSILQLVGRSGMSATEVAEKSQEKWRLMGPAIGNLQYEFLAPFLQRRWSQMRRYDLLPRGMPESVRQMGMPAVDFVSPMAMAQRSADGVAAQRFVEAALALAEFDPEAADMIDIDATIAEFRETMGARPNLMRAPAEVQERRELRRQQQQQQQAVEAAPALAAGMKDMAAAGAANDDSSLAGLGISAG